MQVLLILVVYLHEPMLSNLRLLCSVSHFVVVASANVVHWSLREDLKDFSFFIISFVFFLAQVASAPRSSAKFSSLITVFFLS